MNQGEEEVKQQGQQTQARRKHSYGERKITNIEELKTLVWGLDLDEGIRFIEEVPGRPGKSFVFITKCGEQICITTKERIFDRAMNKYVPGGHEEWKYFNTPEEAWKYIVGDLLKKSPIEAYYY